MQTVIAGIDLITQGAEASLRDYIAAERDAFASRAVFRRTEGLADEMAEFASSLSRATAVDDEFILSQARVFYQLGLTEQQIRRLVPAVLDLAAANPQAGVGGAQQAIVQGLLGRTRALQALGVAFKSTGNQARDFLAIEKAIQREFGGTAAARRAGPTGSVDQLRIELENLRASIGERIGLRFAPVAEGFIAKLQDPRGPEAVIQGLLAGLPPQISGLLRPFLGPVTEAERKRSQETEAALLRQSRGGDPTQRLLAQIEANTRAMRDVIGKGTLSTGGTLAPGTVNARDLQAAIRTAR